MGIKKYKNMEIQLFSHIASSVAEINYILHLSDSVLLNLTLKAFFR